MTRVRWLRGETNVTLRAMAMRMRARAFTAETESGFLLDRARDDRIEGRYIEKMMYEERIIDPFGRELAFDRIAYREAQFTLYRDFPQIEIRDAPRTLQTFMSQLLEMTNFTLSSESLVVDVMHWAEALEHALGTDLLIDTAQLSGITVAPQIVGSMTVNASVDVRKSLKDITNGRPFTVEKVRVTWLQSGSPVTVQLGRSGSAKCDGQGSDFLAILRAALPTRAAYPAS